MIYSKILHSKLIQHKKYPLTNILARGVLFGVITTISKVILFFSKMQFLGHHSLIDEQLITQNL